MSAIVAVGENTVSLYGCGALKREAAMRSVRKPGRPPGRFMRGGRESTAEEESGSEGRGRGGRRGGVRRRGDITIALWKGDEERGGRRGRGREKKQNRAQ